LESASVSVGKDEELGNVDLAGTARAHAVAAWSGAGGSLFAALWFAGGAPRFSWAFLGPVFGGINCCVEWTLHLIERMVAFD
jgi:hypothetical protein